MKQKYGRFSIILINMVDKAREILSMTYEEYVKLKLLYDISNSFNDMKDYSFDEAKEYLDDDEAYIRRKINAATVEELEDGKVIKIILPPEDLHLEKGTY